MFGKKFTEAIPGAMVSLIISAVTSLVVFSGIFSSLQTKVDANTKKIEESADKTSIIIILDRIKEIDKKIDDIYKILIQRRD